MDNVYIIKRLTMHGTLCNLYRICSMHLDTIHKSQHTITCLHCLSESMAIVRVRLLTWNQLINSLHHSHILLDIEAELWTSDGWWTVSRAKYLADVAASSCSGMHEELQRCYQVLLSEQQIKLTSILDRARLDSSRWEILWFTRGCSNESYDVG